MPKSPPKSSLNWSQERVLVTGGAGFLGCHVLRRLQSTSCPSITAPRSHDYDLRKASDIERLLNDCKPSVIIHLAANCGGIGKNMRGPGELFYDNAVMGIQLMEYARRFAVKKYVQVGTVCSYPGDAPTPFREKYIWDGYPEPTNAPYGLAKKMLLVQAQAYRKQYDFNAIYLLPANLYGPVDHFDLVNSHVIPALIRKIDDALREGKRDVEVWGSGKASREFLFVEDAADAIVLAAERYNGSEPLNLGTGTSITIKGLVQSLAKLMKYKGDFHWNKKLPDGQMKRRLDTSLAFKAFGFRAQTTLREGLLKTIAWYRAHQATPEAVL